MGKLCRSFRDDASRRRAYERRSKNQGKLLRNITLKDTGMDSFRGIFEKVMHERQIRDVCREMGGLDNCLHSFLNLALYGAEDGRLAVVLSRCMP